MRKIVDNATTNWGVIYFDELHTYYTEELSEEYKLAVNQLANLTEISEVLESTITEQGDYNDETFNAYVNTINLAKEEIKNPYIIQTRVSELIAEINKAYEELTLREIEVKEIGTELKVKKGKKILEKIRGFFRR